MTFWHNQKYETLEKTSAGGDFFRGIPAKNFPWLLKEITWSDEENDSWKIKIMCLSVEGNELSQKVKAQISLEASCSVSPENLNKMGIESQRLFNLDLTGWNHLSEKCLLPVTCLIDKIEEKSSEFSKTFFKKIKEKYTHQKKKEIISFKIRNCKVSNFS